MNRPWFIWLIYGLCLILLMSGTVWITVTALELDHRQKDAEKQAVVEENVRLALWRMDSIVSPIIARESARPYFTYSAFYPAERAYTRMYSEIKPGEVLMPSPLLKLDSDEILLHFQIDSGDEMSSPQVPTGTMRDLAEASYTTPEEIENSTQQLSLLKGLVKKDILLATLSGKTLEPVKTVSVNEDRLKGVTKGIAQRQEELNVKEQQARKASNVQQMETFQQQQTVQPSESTEVVEEAMEPVWVGESLLLVRRVTVNKEEYIQGCWIDWPHLKGRLLESITDLLPGAELTPVYAEDDTNEGRKLATIPVRITAGALPFVETGEMSAIELSLFIVWFCVGFVAITVALLLLGVVSLGERRGAFVSAVTHELRTPLTTLQMYTEMLVDGMVQDENKKKEYLTTLSTEAARLSRLVENVLSYARLERGRMRFDPETVTLKQLLDTAKERLDTRAKQAGMTLEVSAPEQVMNLQVSMDISAIEQILFNLVDNASKYASGARDKRIHLELNGNKDAAVLRVRDHGPGIARSEARRIFRPFHKSARDAANSAFGVGLGLALSYRLARTMGGKLRLDNDVTDGACFTLHLSLT